MQLLHLIRVDIDPQFESAFNTWYDEVHVPAILACPGWLSARRYVATDGGPKFIAVYELAGSWAYETEIYLRTKGFDDFTPHIRNLVRVQGAFMPSRSLVVDLPDRRKARER